MVTVIPAPRVTHKFCAGDSILLGARRGLPDVTSGRFSRYRWGGSCASTSDPQLHFGLGADAKIDKVTVYRPSGKSQEVAGLEPGAYWDVTEGEARPKRAGVK